MRNVTAPLALGLAAAASLAQAQDLSGEVTVWSWNIAASSLEAVAEGFVAQNPGVTVTVEDLGNAQVFDRMLAARHFGSGLDLLRHCEYSLFDMRLHVEPEATTRVQALAEEVCAEIQPVPAPEFRRYPNTFTHLFDGGYAAGYYGYAWAEVLSADAYSAFEEAGVFDPATGQRFRENILEVGGSRPAMTSFQAFRGREPRLDALLRHQGLV